MRPTIITTSQDFAENITKQCVDLFTHQLNDLISKGLLVIENKTPMLTQDFNTTQLRLSNVISVQLKDKEYIEKLEKENQELKDTLDKMNKAFENSMKLLTNQGS